VAQNYIGQFSFLTLEGDPLAIGEEVITKQRAGVNGTAIWLTGQRGRPFKLRSTVDAFTLGYARHLYGLYRLLIGQFVDVIWNGSPITNETVRVAVLDVRPVHQRTFAMIGGVGGLCPPSRGWVECDWHLVVIEKQAEE